MKKVLVLFFVFMGTYFSSVSQVDSILFLGEYFYQKNEKDKSLNLFKDILKDTAYEKKVPYYQNEINKYRILKQESENNFFIIGFRMSLWEIWKRSPDGYKKLLQNRDLFEQTREFKNPLDDLPAFLEQFRRQYVF